VNAKTLVASTRFSISMPVAQSNGERSKGSLTLMKKNVNKEVTPVELKMWNPGEPTPTRLAMLIWEMVST
jgi:hypothetical protein